VDLVKSLVNLSQRHNTLKAHEEAIQHALEAVARLRELLGGRPDVYRPLLAAALFHAGEAQVAAGYQEAALESGIESLKLYLDVAGQRPKAYEKVLAEVVDIVARWEEEHSKPEAAALVAAVRIWLEAKRSGSLGDALPSGATRDRKG
jgi:hypothetical protein